MTFKSFLPAAATANLLCLAWLLTAVTLSAQTPLPTPSPGGSPHAAKPKIAHLRFLNLLPLDSGDLVLFGAGSTDGQPLQVTPPSNFYATYTSFPPVTTAFRVFRRGSLQTPIKSVNVPLKSGSYFTLLAQLQPDGQPTVDLVDDTPDPDKPPSNQLIVRQFFRGAQAVVTGGSLRSNPLGYGEMQTLTNLPDRGLQLTAVVTMTAGGPPRSLNVDASFQHYRRLTAYIVTDPYNRLRPRVVPDGPTRAEEDAAAAELRAAAQ